MADISDLLRDPLPSLRELLAFYVEAGVDCALMDEPVNRLSDETPEPAPGPETAARTYPPLLRASEMPKPAMRADAAPAPDIAILNAREMAATAPDLDALRALMEGFEGCALKSTATRLVFADGNPQAKIMFVGEAPGRDEDIEGLPFVGSSGK